MNYYKYLFFGVFISSNIFVTAQAQVAVDATTNTKLTPTDNGITIDDGDRIGDNLFHSFQDFSISEGCSATFNIALDVENIFSRVTGGNISDNNGDNIEVEANSGSCQLNVGVRAFKQNCTGSNSFSSTRNTIYNIPIPQNPGSIAGNPSVE